jgi:hypothetical protein
MKPDLMRTSAGLLEPEKLKKRYDTFLSALNAALNQQQQPSSSVKSDAARASRVKTLKVWVSDVKDGCYGGTAQFVSRCNHWKGHHLSRVADLVSKHTDTASIIQARVDDTLLQICSAFKPSRYVQVCPFCLTWLPHCLRLTDPSSLSPPRCLRLAPAGV